MADTATPNLDLLYLQVGAPNREIVVNDGLAVLDSTVAGVLDLDVAGAGEYTLTDVIQGEAKYGTIRLAGLLTGARTLVVPAKGRQYLVYNGTTGAQTLTVTTADGGGVTVDEGAWALLVCDGTDVQATLTGGSGSGPLPTASETQAGIIEIATQAEVLAGTDALRAVTPAGLQAKVDALPGAVPATETQAGVIELATSAEVLAGTDAIRAVTPAGMQVKVNALPVATTTDVGLIELATAAEVTTGTDSTRAVTPQTLASRAATETLAGLVELATVAETTTGTDTTRAVTPTGLAAKLPAGTPLSVARYAASGTEVEASTATLDASGNLGLRTTPGVGLDIAGDSTNEAGMRLTGYVGASSGAPGWTVRKAQGTQAAPARVNTLGDLATLLAVPYVRNAADTADAFTALVRLRLMGDSLDAQGRLSTRFTLELSQASGATVERLRVTPEGNLLLGTTAHGTNLARGLVVGSGTAPTAAHPADAVQAWVADRGGVAGKAALHVRTEDATIHVLGDLAGLGTLCAAMLGSGATYQALNINGGVLLVGASSVQERPQAVLNALWVSSTDATRTARVSLAAYDSVAAREILRGEADGTGGRLSFYGANAVVKPTVTGVKGGNTALASLLSALSSLGLVTDSTTA